MKYFLLSFLCVLSLIGFSQKSNNNSFYKPRPKTFTPVNDFAGMLTKEERAALTKKLLHYRDTSTNVLVIITQKTLKDPGTGEVYQLEEAARHYANNWGIGLKEKNNGVLIFVVKEDRKVRIATGTGIEDVLTNDDCQQIIDDNIVPEFKKNNYYHGLDTAIEEIMQILSPGLYGSAGEATVVNDIPGSGSQSYSYPKEVHTTNSSPWSFIILILLIIAVVWGIVKRIAGNRSENTVYNSSGSLRPFFSGGRGLLWFLSGIFASSFINNRNNYNNNNYHSNNNSSNNDNSFSSSSDNFSSASSDSFSSSSDSGSSFGGGDSDGGGASGSW